MAARKQNTPTDEVLDARKAAILRRVVAEHIESGQPVGSAHIVREGAVDVSPATVRADMAALEREGYLTHPHTSAGRIPTDKGYRFFVDSLEEPSALDPAHEEQVRNFFARAHGELERMLRDTSQLLSRLTDYAAVVVGPAHDALSVHSLLLTRLGPRVCLLVVVLSNGAVEKHVVDVPEETTDEEIDAAAAALREQLIGKRLGALGQPRRSGRRALDGIVSACHRALAGVREVGDADEVFVGGAARMAEQFRAVDTVREVLAILEQSFVVVSLIRDVLAQGQSVSIGTEHGVSSLAECSLVVAPYTVDERVVGTIGVLGPTRMDYRHALAAVAVVSERLGRQLSGGGE
ncbi:MAG TPA: heat-inducible transcriptional repressor HrcA [Acidimicrobiales bacterium]|nr:heat-inducible transcriptional repressor HrcA [Acidimicrobiales bacterium]